jgi:hypothetical protein
MGKVSMTGITARVREGEEAWAGEKVPPVRPNKIMGIHRIRHWFLENISTSGKPIKDFPSFGDKTRGHSK